MSSEGNKSKSGLVIGLLLIGVIALGVLLYLRSEEKHTLELEKQELTIELSGLKEDLSLASQKRRGGLGVNIAIGLVLCAIYVFAMQISQTFATT